MLRVETALEDYVFSIRGHFNIKLPYYQQYKDLSYKN